MTLYRVVHNKENPYLKINTTIATDTRLSWKAKGIWLCILRKKSDGKFYEKDLVEENGESISSLRSGLKELEEYGYLEEVANG